MAKTIKMGPNASPLHEQHRKILHSLEMKGLIKLKR